jgi:uncharacterized FlaG/YvyC family protein
MARSGAIGDDAVLGPRALDQRLPERRQREAGRDAAAELERAFVELKAAVEGASKDLKLWLDPAREVVVVYVAAGDERRVLREIEADELQRLVQLVRAGKPVRLLDRRL